MKAFKSFFSIIIFICALNIIQNSLAVAQSDIGYLYDSNGNRISRSITLKKSATVNDSINNKSKIEFFKDEFGELKIRIYPNPTHGKLEVALTGIDPNFPSAISIIDVKGTIIKEFSPASTSNIIDLSNSDNGLYIIEISANNISTKWKVVKQ